MKKTKEAFWTLIAELTEDNSVLDELLKKKQAHDRKDAEDSARRI